MSVEDHKDWPCSHSNSFCHCMNTESCTFRISGRFYAILPWAKSTQEDWNICTESVLAFWIHQCLYESFWWSLQGVLCMSVDSSNLSFSALPAQCCPLWAGSPLCIVQHKAALTLDLPCKTKHGSALSAERNWLSVFFFLPTLGLGRTNP